MVATLIVVSDLHCGCRLGLFPPHKMTLDEGMIVEPSVLQLKLAAWWEEFWKQWVPQVCRKDKFAVCINGDAIDGRHHGAVTQVSQNLADQSLIAKTILAPILEACQGRFYMVRGTESHVGPSAEEEERLARELGAIPGEFGQHAQYEIWFRLGGKSLVHCAHHIGTAGAMHYESSALSKELSEAYVESGRWNDEPPAVVVRSHRHRNTEVRVQTAKGFATVCTTPGWQLHTPFAYRIAGARQARPQIGGTVVRQGDEDIYTRHKVWSLSRPREVVL